MVLSTATVPYIARTTIEIPLRLHSSPSTQCASTIRARLRDGYACHCDTVKKLKELCTIHAQGLFMLSGVVDYSGTAINCEHLNAVMLALSAEGEAASEPVRGHFHMISLLPYL